MVKFGVRFEEGSASRHWQSSHVAYGALKKVLKRASQASGRPVGRSNYGPPGRGLLDLEEVRRPSDTFLERGLDDDDKRTLETLRGRLLKQNKEDDLSDEEEESKEYDEEVASLTPTSLNKKLWIRALDRDKSRAFFLHGFDCALAAEVATAERRYSREAASLERRWTAIAPSCRQYDDSLEASKAAPEPLKLQLAALDSEARALVDFVVWNLCAVEKISKKRDKLFPEEPPIRGRVVGILRARDAWTAPRARALSGQLRDACAALSGKTEQLGTAAAVSELRRLGTARGGEAPAPDESRRRAFEDLGRSASFDDSMRPPSPTTSDEVEVASHQPVASVGVCCFQRKRSKGVGLQPPPVGERLVFLDVDGVLHSINAHDKDTLNNACCDSLETIVRATDARLVLTGAWRLYPALVERVEALLKKRGLRPLLGKAPSLTAKGHNREREIRAWFVNNRPKKDPGRRWIALDAGRLDGLRGHLVRTDGEKGLTQLDATIATGLLRGDAGAFLLGCRPDKPCQFCDPRRRLFADTLRALSTPGRAPSDATTPSKHSEVRVTSPASLHRLLSSHRLSSDQRSVSSNESRKTTTSESWLCPSSSAKTLTLVEFDDQEALETVKAVDLASLCVDPQRRAAAGLTSLGRGAYADVVCFNASTAVECDAVKIPARKLAVKVGAWPSEKSFQRECDCQALAAKSNSAPAVRARAWAGGAAGVGAIVMDRLTCPSFHVWLLYGRGVPGCLHAIDATRVHQTTSWVSRDFSRRPGFGSKERWLIDPRVHRLPLVKAWASEARRARKALNDAGIRHGDVHDANVVFDVSSCADKVFRGSMGDAKALKRVLMREIGRGPSQSSARLVVVDFGRARKADGFSRWLLRACGDDHRMVDPQDCERVSDITDVDMCVSDLESEAYIGKVPDTLKGGLAGLQASFASP